MIHTIAVSLLLTLAVGAPFAAAEPILPPNPLVTEAQGRSNYRATVLSAMIGVIAAFVAGYLI